MPKLAPAPRTAQNRSSFSSLLARSIRPSAVTISADHDPVVDRSPPGDVVPAAADGNFQVEATCQVHGVDYIGHSAASCDQRRPFVDKAVVNPAGVLVTGIVRQQNIAGKDLP